MNDNDLANALFWWSKLSRKEQDNASVENLPVYEARKITSQKEIKQTPPEKYNELVLEVWRKVHKH